MRSRFALSLFVILAAGNVLAQDLSTDKGKLSYSVGWDLGADIKNRVSEFDVEALILAIRDSVADREPQVDVQEMRQLLTALQEKVRKEQLEAFQELAQENQVKSETFLEANKSKTGIVVLPSGIQYRIIEEGDGARPGPEPEEARQLSGSARGHCRKPRSQLDRMSLRTGDDPGRGARHRPL